MVYRRRAPRRAIGRLAAAHVAAQSLTLSGFMSSRSSKCTFLCAARASSNFVMVCCSRPRFRLRFWGVSAVIHDFVAMSHQSWRPDSVDSFCEQQGRFIAEVCSRSRGFTSTTHKPQCCSMPTKAGFTRSVNPTDEFGQDTAERNTYVSPSCCS